MNKAHIKLAYRQTIDHTVQTSFEQDVFNDTWQEFLMQAQAYNRENKFTTLQQMIDNNPKANSLHYKVGFAIGLYVNGLHNQVPGLKDTLDVVSIPFVTHRFQIVASDITNKQAHKVAITYITDTMTLLDDIDSHFLLSVGEQPAGEANEWVDSFLLPLQAGLSVCNYRLIVGSQESGVGSQKQQTFSGIHG